MDSFFSVLLSLSMDGATELALEGGESEKQQNSQFGIYLRRVRTVNSQAFSNEFKFEYTKLL